MLSIFSTRRIWQRILQPWESHPLFMQVTPQPFRPKRHGALWWIGAGALILNPCTIAMSTLTIIPVVLFTAAGFIFGLKLAFGVSSVIAAQKETGRFDLLKLTPPGEYGIYMLLVQAMFRRKNVLLGFGIERDLIFQTLLAVAAAVGVSLALHDSSDWWTLFTMVVIALALHIDFRQSVVLGTLCALLGSTFTDTRLNARLISMVSYTGIQLVWYLLSIGAVVLVTQTAFALLDGLDLLIAPILMLLFVAAFGLREGVIIALDGRAQQANT